MNLAHELILGLQWHPCHSQPHTPVDLAIVAPKLRTFAPKWGLAKEKTHQPRSSVVCRTCSVAWVGVDWSAQNTLSPPTMLPAGYLWYRTTPHNPSKVPHVQRDGHFQTVPHTAPRNEGGFSSKKITPNWSLWSIREGPRLVSDLLWSMCKLHKSHSTEICEIDTHSLKQIYVSESHIFLTKYVWDWHKFETIKICGIYTHCLS